MAEDKLKGLKDVINNLNKIVAKVEDKTLKGLIRAAIIVRRDMDKTSPLIPVDWGNLRASWFIVTSEGEIPYGAVASFRGPFGPKVATAHSATLAEAATMRPVNGPFVVMGFGAYYARYVHEMGIDPPKEINWSRPGSGPKFFENSIDRNLLEMVYVIAKEAKV